MCLNKFILKLLEFYVLNVLQVSTIHENYYLIELLKI